MNSGDARRPLARGYRVMVDDNFHFMDEEERHCHGELRATAEALECGEGDGGGLGRGIGDGGGKALPRLYMAFGDDPFIVAFGGAEEPGEKFSAWDYAKICAEKIAAQRAGK